MIIKEEHLEARANNFTLVRLVLASSVIYTHCYWIVTGREGTDDLSALMGAPVSAYAVDGFFFLSGFLVYPSLLRLRGAVSFLAARLARLWPALALCVGLTVLCGYFVTSVSGAAYFSDETLKFIVGNLTFVRGAYTLTGVTCGSESCNVNGSLWTLTWEARCYLLLAGLGAVGLAKPRIMKLVVLPASVLGALIWHLDVVQVLVRSGLGSGAVYEINVFDRLWTAFALGVGAYLFRERIKLSWWALAALFLANVVANWLGAGLHMRGLFVGYAILCVGFLTAKTRAVSGGWPDYSYGMYIFAFPLMIVIQAMWQTSSYLALALANACATLPLAALSWHFVEKPVLVVYRTRRAQLRVRRAS